MTKQVIASFLKQLRKTSGLSANEVVEKLKDYNIDISSKTLYGYESGLSMLNADAFVSLCRIYKCDNPMDMFGIPSIKPEEIQHIEKYRSLDPSGQSHVDSVLDWETERVKQLKKTQEQISELENRSSILPFPKRLLSYYGRIAAAGKSYGFEDILCGTIEIPSTDSNQSADYTIGVSGDSMHPDFNDGDIVYVQKTDHLNRDDIGIFQKDNCIYIKKVGDGELVSINPSYNPIPGEDVKVLGKVIGKIEEEYKIIK